MKTTICFLSNYFKEACLNRQSHT